MGEMSFYSRLESDKVHVLVGKRLAAEQRGVLPSPPNPYTIPLRNRTIGALASGDQVCPPEALPNRRAAA